MSIMRIYERPRTLPRREALRPTREDLTDGWAADIRFALRSLRHASAFAIPAVLMLALGLGTNAATVSFLDQILFRAPDGITSPGDVKRLWVEQPLVGSGRISIENTLSFHQYQAIAPAVRGRFEIALYTVRNDARLGRGSETAALTYATANYFDALGVHAAAGRFFTEAEADVHGASPLVVVSDAFWRERLGGRRDVIGSSLIVDDRAYTVVGVAPARFHGVDLQATDLWVPLGMFPTRQTPRVSFWESSVTTFSAFGRLLPGASDQLVESRLTAAFRNVPKADFPTSPNAVLVLRSIIDARGPGAMPQEVSIAVRLALVAGIILLMTIANVVNLLLARTTSRRREVAVRLTLGISRVRLVRLFLIEGMLLSSLAGLAAIVSAQLTGAALRSVVLPGVRFPDGPLRWQVAASLMVLAVVTGVVVAWLPAKQASNADLASALRTSETTGQGRSVLPSLLVGTQVAFSVVLLVAAALFVESLRNVERRQIGFQASQIAFASIRLPEGQQSDTLGFASAMRSVGERLRAVSGVEAVAFARDEPMTWPGHVSVYSATDSSEAPWEKQPTASYVSSDYFRAVGLGFARGATFSDVSSVSANAVVVSKTLAQMLWRDHDPVGQCVHVQRRDEACLIVVGVVDDAIRERLLEDPAPALYLPLFRSIRGQRPPNVLVIRADPERLPSAMLQASRLLHLAFPRGTPSVVRMSDRLAPQYRPWQLGAALFSGIGLLALLVAALGIYSSVSYAVSQQSRAIGVRIALGATLLDVLRHVVGRGVRPVAIGGVVGGVLAIASARVIASLLFGVGARDPLVIVGVVAALLVAGSLAALIPGLRATRIDPVRVMSGE